MTPLNDATNSTGSSIASLIRLLGAVVGTWVIAKGYFTAEEWANFIPAAAIVGAAVWGIYDKIATKRQMASAVQTGAVLQAEHTNTDVAPALANPEAVTAALNIKAKDGGIVIPPKPTQQ